MILDAAFSDLHAAATATGLGLHQFQGAVFLCPCESLPVDTRQSGDGFPVTLSQADDGGSQRKQESANTHVTIIAQVGLRCGSPVIHSRRGTLTEAISS